MQAGGEVRIGEAAAAASWALSRANGVGVGMYTAYLAVLFVAMFLVIGLSEIFLPELAGAGGSVLVIALAVLGLIGLPRFTALRIRRTQLARGGVDPVPVTYRTDEGGLVMEQPHAVTRIEWPGISEILALRAHWVFVVSGMGYCLPRRFFADVAVERAFIRVVLERLDAPARERSGKALSFVRWE